MSAIAEYAVIELIQLINQSFGGGGDSGERIISGKNGHDDCELNILTESAWRNVSRQFFKWHWIRRCVSVYQSFGAKFMPMFNMCRHIDWREWQDNVIFFCILLLHVFIYHYNLFFTSIWARNGGMLGTWKHDSIMELGCILMTIFHWKWQKQGQNTWKRKTEKLDLLSTNWTSFFG